MSFTTKHTVTIDIDTAALRGYTDSYLAMAWHAAQANPADGFDEQGPGRLAEVVGREIIRRWLRTVDPELWHHQGEHYYWKPLTELGHWEDGTFVPDTPPTGDASTQPESSDAASPAEGAR